MIDPEAFGDHERNEEPVELHRLTEDLRAALTTLTAAFGPAVRMMYDELRQENGPEQPLLFLVEAIHSAPGSEGDEEPLPPAPRRTAEELDALASQQGIRPFTQDDIPALTNGSGGPWESDEEFEAWLRDIYRARQADTV